MDPQTPPEIGRLNPDQLIRPFRRVDVFVIGLALAFGIHILVLGGTSIGFIGKLLEPPKEEMKEGEAPGPAAGPAGPESAAPDAAAKPAAAKPPAPGLEGIPADKREHPEVKAVTEPAKPGDIPQDPTKTGISLDETTGTQAP
jgi:hypothetical protein